MNRSRRRFFTPNDSWKYADTPVKIKRRKNKRAVRGFKDDNIDTIINNSTELLDFAISFTKRVVQISFLLFVVVNLYILIMISINFFTTSELVYLDTLITESYGMLRDVIAAYIIKAATENSLRIAFSVISDFLNKKYDIKVDPDEDNYDEFDVDDINPIIDDSEDPTGEDEMEGGIDIL